MPVSHTLEFALFSGDYAGVLARTAERFERADTPAVIGALSLTGRLDEAKSLFASFSAQVPGHEDFEEERAQAGFYLIAGLCHAGRVQRALPRAQRYLGDLRAPQPKRRFWAFQGLALVRYFEGFFPQTRRLARKALSAATQAGFAYGRFLALDLLAHVALHTGEAFAGVRLLSQAEALAEALGYADNANNQRTAQSVARLRMLLLDLDQALAAVEAEISAGKASYFTQRSALVELASFLALRGQAQRARQALEEARKISLLGSDQRGKTRWFLSQALCAGLAESHAQAAAHLEHARECAADSLTLQAEVGFVELGLLRASASEAAIGALRSIAHKTGIQRAWVASAVASGHSHENPLTIEDGLSRALLECQGRSARERVSLLIQYKLYGLTSWALGREPGRRLILTGRELITENRGMISVAELPSRPALKLLLTLRRGFQTRAEILKEVWAIQRYVPTRHTSVLHTTVSRLRTALGEADWIITHEDGYSLAPEVEVVSWDDAATLSLSVQPQPSEADRDRVLRFFLDREPASCAEVAAALELSPSTALRLLRQLSAEGRLTKSGAGRTTRYSRC